MQMFFDQRQYRYLHRDETGRCWRGVVVHTHDELKDALQKAISNKEIGIILLTEKFGREFPEIIDDVKLHHKTPLIIEIPDRHGTGRKPDFITSYVNEAIGLKL